MPDARDRWREGWIRHLNSSPDCPLDSVSATSDGFGVYTLNVHLCHAWRADEYRDLIEPKLEAFFA